MLLDQSALCADILSAKKYAHLHPPLVARICREESPKHARQKEAAKAIKNKLHTMFGAYAEGLDKAVALAENAAQESAQTVAARVLPLHASTRERAPYVAEALRFVFGVTGPAASILDVGCGLNPFTLPFFPAAARAGLSAYHAWDIDRRLAAANNAFFAREGLPLLAACVDAAGDTFPREIPATDVALFFKLMPLLQRQRLGCAAAWLRHTPATWRVVSFPTKSLGGREKGMRQTYAAALEEMAGMLQIAASREIGDEMFYVLQ